MKLRNALALSALAVSAAVTGLALADDVKSNSTQTLEKFYGRAGGLTDSDRVTHLTAGNQPVGVTWDRDVASRTNMSVDRPAVVGGVGVTYDPDVAARTNMQRGSSTSVVAEHPKGSQSN
jgi:hypothetical protein